MKKGNLQNERLDQIGLRLLDAARLQSDEIDRIASAPHLFNSVKARIKAEESRVETKGFSVLWNNLWGSPWQTIGVSFGALALLLSCVIGWVVLTKQDTYSVAQKIQPQRPAVVTPQMPEIKTEVAAVEETRGSSGKDRVSAQPAFFRSKRPLKSPVAKHRSNIEEMGEFYALTGDSGEDDGDGQIIRVELPRSSLYAMGINVPVENESGKIKTDLLIGSDGVMRAVRFVK